jgi:hypothetical protein
MDIDCGRGNHSTRTQAPTSWDGVSAKSLTAGVVGLLEDANLWQELAQGLSGFEFASFCLRGVLRVSSSNAQAHGHH